MRDDVEAVVDDHGAKTADNTIDDVSEDCGGPDPTREDDRETSWTNCLCANRSAGMSKSLLLVEYDSVAKHDTPKCD